MCFFLAVVTAGDEEPGKYQVELFRCYRMKEPSNAGSDFEKLPALLKNLRICQCLLLYAVLAWADDPLIHPKGQR
jgi:hypothetical protein